MVRIIKKTPVKCVSKPEQKKVKSSQIGPDSENTRELVDSNFKQLSFIQALGMEVLVRGVGDQVPYENGGIGGGGGDQAPL